MGLLHGLVPGGRGGAEQANRGDHEGGVQAKTWDSSSPLLSTAWRSRSNPSEQTESACSIPPLVLERNPWSHARDRMLSALPSELLCTVVDKYGDEASRSENAVRTKEILTRRHLTTDLWVHNGDK